MTPEYLLAIAAGSILLLVAVRLVLFILRGLLHMSPRHWYSDPSPQPVCGPNCHDAEHNLTGWQPEQQAELPGPARHLAIQAGHQSPALPARQRPALPGINRPALPSGERGVVIEPAHKVKVRR